MEGRIKPSRCPSAPPAMRLKAQSKNMDIRSERLLSISLDLGFEGDSRNGDKLGSDWCILCNPFSEEVRRNAASASERFPGRQRFRSIHKHQKPAATQLLDAGRAGWGGLACRW